MKKHCSLKGQDLNFVCAQSLENFAMLSKKFIKSTRSFTALEQSYIQHAIGIFEREQRLKLRRLPQAFNALKAAISDYQKLDRKFDQTKCLQKISQALEACEPEEIDGFKNCSGDFALKPNIEQSHIEETQKRMSQHLKTYQDEILSNLEHNLLLILDSGIDCLTPKAASDIYYCFEKGYFSSLSHKHSIDIIRIKNQPSGSDTASQASVSTRTSPFGHPMSKVSSRTPSESGEFGPSSSSDSEAINNSKESETSCKQTLYHWLFNFFALAGVIAVPVIGVLLMKLYDEKNTLIPDSHSASNLHAQSPEPELNSKASTADTNLEQSFVGSSREDSPEAINTAEMLKPTHLKGDLIRTVLKLKPVWPLGGVGGLAVGSLQFWHLSSVLKVKDLKRFKQIIKAVTHFASKRGIASVRLFLTLRGTLYGLAIGILTEFLIKNFKGSSTDTQ